MYRSKKNEIVGSFYLYITFSSHFPHTHLGHTHKHTASSKSARRTFVVSRLSPLVFLSSERETFFPLLLLEEEVF